ncbi:enolase C-terminal domain-like protein, partial [Stomatohabitans albus]
VDEAIARVKAYNDAARPQGADTRTPGLEYVEQPCQRLQDLAEVRAATGVRVAADESIRLAPDPFEIPGLDQAADLIVVKAAPLGGVRRARAVVDTHGLPCVISSALESAVGMRAGVALAASVPTLAGACGLGTGQLFNHDVSWPISTTGEEALGPVSPNNLDYVDRLDGLEHLTAQLRDTMRSDGDKNTLTRRDWTDGD